VKIIIEKASMPFPKEGTTLTADEIYAHFNLDPSMSCELMTVSISTPGKIKNKYDVYKLFITKDINDTRQFQWVDTNFNSIGNSF
jgi:hypothetical protein